ncbi:MAG TPA: cation-translocating P-type ATPase [Candidatus Brocadiia bacterium]|nr:cation-translocating P-type ATPase [Candidatus Brocadiia bacterium]
MSKPDSVPAFAEDVSSVLSRHEVALASGLSPEEAARRMEKHGPNELPAAAGRTFLQMVADQFKDALIYILLGATVVSILLGEQLDAAVIFAIVVLNAVLGVIQESRAEKSLEALKKLASPRARVLRGGMPIEIFSREIVPGDIILLEAGNYVPADARIVESANLRVQESALTGESEPVTKLHDPILDPGTLLGDRRNMVFSGTLVVYGRAKAVAVATGLETELGKIAKLLSAVEAEETPLQKQLNKVGKWLGIVICVICVVVFVAAEIRGPQTNVEGHMLEKRAFHVEMFMTAVSLAVAAIPEGLAAVVTIVLALGMRNMVKRHAIIRRLSAVETLGCTTVICTDKTGTLTQNAMVVRSVYLADGKQFSVTGHGYDPAGKLTDTKGSEVPAQEVEAINELLAACVLCNDGQLVQKDGQWRIIGDPTEGALVVLGEKLGFAKQKSEQERPRIDEVPFDSATKRMVTLHKTGDYIHAFIKGAPDVVLSQCSLCLDGGKVRELTDADRERIEAVNSAYAANALRVLGCAMKEIPEKPQDLDGATSGELVFLGLAAMSDPIRPEVLDAVTLCRHAGIRPVVITGDYPITALAISKELGIAKEGDRVVNGRELAVMPEDELRQTVKDVSVYARVSPEDKLRIVRALKAHGHIAAMTGDGVNDAPALKQADIGVAMGITGTDVSKEASDMVLTDDNFASIVAAVEEGRAIFENIRKFIFFLLSCNITEVLTIFVSIMSRLPLPLAPVQILWMNLVTDGLPALALGVDPKPGDLMDRPPRDPKESVLDKRTWFDIGLYGVILATLVLGAYLLSLSRHGSTGDELHRARTVAFTTLVLVQLANSFNCRSARLSIFSLPFNPLHLLAVVFSAALQAMVIYVPFLQKLFKTTPLDAKDLMIVLVCSILPIPIVEIYKAIRRAISK